MSKDHNRQTLQEQWLVTHSFLYTSQPMQKDNFFTPNAYNLDYLTFQKNPVAFQCRVALQYHKHWEIEDIFLKKFPQSCSVDSPIFTYSSVASAGKRYASIQNATVIFCNGDSPSLPTPSFFFYKNTGRDCGLLPLFEEAKIETFDTIVEIC